MAFGEVVVVDALGEHRITANRYRQDENDHQDQCNQNGAPLRRTTPAASSNSATLQSLSASPAFMAGVILCLG